MTAWLHSGGSYFHSALQCFSLTQNELCADERSNVSVYGRAKKPVLQPRRKARLAAVVIWIHTFSRVLVMRASDDSAKCCRNSCSESVHSLNLCTRSESVHTLCICALSESVHFQRPRPTGYITTAPATRLQMNWLPAVQKTPSNVHTATTSTDIRWISPALSWSHGLHVHTATSSTDIRRISRVLSWSHGLQVRTAMSDYASEELAGCLVSRRHNVPKDPCAQPVMLRVQMNRPRAV